MGGGLLIFYVTNETNETNENKCAFCRILRQKHRILPYFAAAFSAQKPYLCTEFQSALKLQTNMLIVNCKLLIVLWNL